MYAWLKDKIAHLGLGAVYAWLTLMFAAPKCNLRAPVFIIFWWLAGMCVAIGIEYYQHKYCKSGDIPRVLTSEWWESMFDALGFVAGMFVVYSSVMGVFI